MYNLKKHYKKGGKIKNKYISQSPTVRRILKDNNSKRTKRVHQSTQRASKILQHIQHPQIPDFTREIKNRFEKSLINKIYTFPKFLESDQDSSSTDEDFNLELQSTTVYDLFSQNLNTKQRRKHKRKQSKPKQERKSSPKTIKEYNLNISKEQIYIKNFDKKVANKENKQVNQRSPKRVKNKTYNQLLGVLQKNLKIKKIAREQIKVKQESLRQKIKERMARRRIEVKTQLIKKKKVKRIYANFQTSKVQKGGTLQASPVSRRKHKKNAQSDFKLDFKKRKEFINHYKEKLKPKKFTRKSKSPRPAFNYGKIIDKLKRKVRKEVAPTYLKTSNGYRSPQGRLQQRKKVQKVQTVNYRQVKMDKKSSRFILQKNSSRSPQRKEKIPFSNISNLKQKKRGTDKYCIIKKLKKVKGFLSGIEMRSFDLQFGRQSDRLEIKENHTFFKQF